MYVNKQEFSASSWRSNQGYTWRSRPAKSQRCFG